MGKCIVRNKLLITFFFKGKLKIHVHNLTGTKIKCSVFEQVEGLWKVGHIGIAEGEPVITSARRWRKWGLFRVSVSAVSVLMKLSGLLKTFN